MDANSVLTLINKQKPGWSLDQAFYVDPFIFELELAHIWNKYWLFAGTIADIPKPGDYFTYKINKESIIIIRGDEGEVYAHFNTCRHRGSLICLEERGRAPKLMCPYHQWVYEKDGRLAKARLMPDDFDRTQFSLAQAQVKIADGLIFICLSDNPPDFEPVRNDWSDFLRPFRIGAAKVACRKRYTLRTNWKLIGENFRECYHCGPAHPEYCSAVIGANLHESAEQVLQNSRQRWQQLGLAVDTVQFEKDSFHFAIRYPLRPGVESYSLDGKPVAIPMGDHTSHDAGVLGLVCYPNFWMDAVSDYVWTMRLTATSASETIIDLTWLVDGKAVEGKDYDVDRLISFWKITGEQDWSLCENSFKGIESSRYRPGPYSPPEADVAAYVDWYLARMRSGVVR